MLQELHPPHQVLTPLLSESMSPVPKLRLETEPPVQDQEFADLFTASHENHDVSTTRFADTWQREMYKLAIKLELFYTVLQPGVSESEINIFLQTKLLPRLVQAGELIHEQEGFPVISEHFTLPSGLGDGWSFEMRRIENSTPLQAVLKIECPVIGGTKTTTPEEKLKRRILLTIHCEGEKVVFLPYKVELVRS